MKILNINKLLKLCYSHLSNIRSEEIKNSTQTFLMKKILSLTSNHFSPYFFCNFLQIKYKKKITF